MTNHYQCMLDGQLERAYKMGEGNKLNPQRVYLKLSDELRPIRERRKSAPFLGCITRRKGYHLQMSPETFVKLSGGNITRSEEVYAECNERWEQGLPWKPFRMCIKPFEDLWRVFFVNRKDIQAAMFLLEKGQSLLRAQAFHELDKPANTECLNSIRQLGLVPCYGKRTPVKVNAIVVAM